MKMALCIFSIVKFEHLTISSEIRLPLVIAILKKEDGDHLQRVKKILEEYMVISEWTNALENRERFS